MFLTTAVRTKVQGGAVSDRWCTSGFYVGAGFVYMLLCVMMLSNLMTINTPYGDTDASF